jgi:Tol biopolymer transport system component
MLRRVSGVLAAVSCAILLVVVATPSARAASPGTNGRVAFVRNGNIFTVRSDGTGVRQLTTDGRNFVPRWSPDGQRIAFQHASELWAMRADGRGKHRVVQRLKAGRPTWSPDGRTLAFNGRPSNEPSVYVYQISSDAVDGTATRLRRYDRDQEAYVDVSTQNGPIAWSPSGRYLVYEGGECTGIYDNCMTVLDLLTGVEQTDFAYGGGGSYSGRAYSPDWLPSSAGYLVSERRCIDEKCTGGYQQRLALANGSAIANGYHGVYSPSGTRVAYTKNTGSTPHVYTATATGGSARRLIQGRDPDWQPRP